MATCTVEVGLLSKKPCGQPSVTHCLNCEMTLCSKHAVPEMAGTRKTGKFLCKECHAAHKVHDKITPVAAPSPAPAAPKPAPAAKPAAPAPAKPGAVAKAAAPKEPPKKEEKKPDDDAPLEFTPTKK